MALSTVVAHAHDGDRGKGEMGRKRPSPPQGGNKAEPSSHEGREAAEKWLSAPKSARGAKLPSCLPTVRLVYTGVNQDDTNRYRPTLLRVRV